MKLVNILLVFLLGILLEINVVSSLKFAIHDAIKVNNPENVVEVGKQTKFTCNYLKAGRRETVSVIRWFVTYENSNANYGNVFEHRVSTGQKINNAAGLSHFTVFDDSATEKDIDIKLNEYKESPITITCEVEAEKDNGYGRVSTHKKAVKVSFAVVEAPSTTNAPQTSEHNLHNDVHQLLTMIDPRRHSRPGVPYDFYSGYIMMISKVPEIGGSHNYRNQHSSQSVQLFGQLPADIIRELQATQRRFQEVSDKKYKLEMEPVDVLNLLGNHGFRAIGSTSTADQKIVWTLEQRDFENLI